MDTGWIIATLAVISIFGPLSVILYRTSRRLAKASNGYRNDSKLYYWWSIVVAAIVVICTLLFTFIAFNATQSQGTALEATLNTQYAQDQNDLSSYVVTFNEEMGVAQLQTSKIADIDRILMSSVSSNSAFSDSSVSTSSPLYLALARVMPQVNLQQYQDVLHYIQAGRGKFEAEQAQLLHDLSALDKWRESGFLIHPIVVGFFGFPDGNLHAQVSQTRLLTGAAAEQQMWKIAENPSAVLSIDNGSLQPLPIPGK